MLVHDLIVHCLYGLRSHIFAFPVRSDPFSILVKKRHAYQILRISDVV